MLAYTDPKLNRTMKKIVIMIPGIVCMIALYSQDAIPPEPTDADTLWKVTGITSLNLSQLSLSNWAAGGENSVSGNALLKLSPDFDDGTLSWDNDLALGFGLIKQGTDPARKSDDQIEIDSKLGYKASKKWKYTILLSFKTQFAAGYDKPAEDNRMKISAFMAPGYLNLSAGMDFKASKHFSLFLSLLTGKMTVVRDPDLAAAGVFGLDPGENLRAEIGGYIKMAFKKEVLKNVTVDTKADFFSNYLDDPQFVDINWNMLVAFKVNEYISASIFTHLIYDHDILFAFDSDGDGTNDGSEPRVQFKELFGIGLSYSF